MFPRSRFCNKITSTATASVVLLGSLTPSMSEPSHPAWWNDKNVKSGNPAQNKGVANIGQLKHIATQAYDELETLLPGGAGYALPFDPPPASPDPAWYQNQKKALNLGQLKAVSKPLYDRLNAIAPQWLKSQMELNGLTVTGSPPYYPWNPSTPVSENYKPANVGQLKLVFALRLRTDSDSDGMADIFEYGIIAADTGGTLQTLADVNPGDDFDNDGLTNLEEFQLQTDPTKTWFDGSKDSEQYVYDDLGRLINVTGSQSRNYQYDPSGNIEAAN